MRIIVLDDDGTPIDGLMVSASDLTYIRNGNADWLSLTVEARQAVLSFIIQTFQRMVPQPIAQTPTVPAHVLKFRKP
jgi:hypothetical protein